MVITTKSRQESSANLQSLAENSDAEDAKVEQPSVNETMNMTTEKTFQHPLTNPDKVKPEAMPAVTTEAVVVSENNLSKTQEQVLPNDSLRVVSQSLSLSKFRDPVLPIPQHDTELV